LDLQCHRPTIVDTGAASSFDADYGPVRTANGDRITVYGDLEVISVEARHVTVRVVRPSAPPPEPVMFPAR
jgi:hypothetical protein